MGGREPGFCFNKLPFERRKSFIEPVDSVPYLGYVRRGGDGYGGVKVRVEFRVGLSIAYRRIVPLILNYNRVKGS